MSLPAPARNPSVPFRTTVPSNRKAGTEGTLTLR